MALPKPGEEETHSRKMVKQHDSSVKNHKLVSFFFSTLKCVCLWFASALDLKSFWLHVWPLQMLVELIVSRSLVLSFLDLIHFWFQSLNPCWCWCYCNQALKLPTSFLSKQLVECWIKHFQGLKSVQHKFYSCSAHSRSITRRKVHVL